jgi:hypothetical protein
MAEQGPDRALMVRRSPEQSASVCPINAPDIGNSPHLALARMGTAQVQL